MAVLNAKAVESKVRELNGNLAAVGRFFGVSRQAVHDFVAKRPKLVAAVADCREAMKDHAESSLYRAVLAGEAWAVCFHLKCQAKDRGYVEKMVVGGDGGPPVKVAPTDSTGEAPYDPLAGLNALLPELRAAVDRQRQEAGGSLDDGPGDGVG
jgi:hypothetical protein